MKAKELAAKIVVGIADNSRLATEVLVEVSNEAIGVANSRQAEASRLAALREGFQKWRSVVAQVKSAAPDVSIAEGNFLKAMYLSSPVLFAQCMAGNVFLGYTLDEADKSALEHSRHELAKVEVSERRRRQLEEDKRFDRAFGLSSPLAGPRAMEEGRQEALGALAAMLFADHIAMSRAQAEKVA